MGAEVRKLTIGSLLDRQMPSDSPWSTGLPLTSGESLPWWPWPPVTPSTTPETHLPTLDSPYQIILPLLVFWILLALVAYAILKACQIQPVREPSPWPSHAARVDRLLA